MVQALRQKYGEAPEPEPEPFVEPEPVFGRPRVSDRAAAPNPLQPPRDGRGLLPPVRVTADAPSAREAVEGKMNLLHHGYGWQRKLGEFEGGLEAGMSALPFTSLRVVTPVESWRKQLDNLTARSVAPAVEATVAGGGSPESLRFKAGMLTPVLAGGVAAQAPLISLLSAGVRGAVGAAAARGVTGAAAASRALNAERATALGRAIQKDLPGTVASAGLTAATTGADDDNLLLGKGRGNAVLEDVLLSGAGTAISPALDAARGALRAARPAIPSLSAETKAQLATGARNAAMGVAVGAAAHNATQDDAEAGEVAAPLMAASLMTPAGRVAFKAFSRLDEVVDGLSGPMRAADLLKRLPNAAPKLKAEMDARGLTAMLEEAKNAGRTVTPDELRAHLASNNPLLGGNPHGIPARTAGSMPRTERAVARHEELKGLRDEGHTVAKSLLDDVLDEAPRDVQVHIPYMLDDFREQVASRDWSVADILDAMEKHSELNLVAGFDDAMEELRRRAPRLEAYAADARRLNARRAQLDNEGRDERSLWVDRPPAQWREYISRGPHEGYRETVVRIPDADPEVSRSGHFSDRGYGSHWRATDREDADGNPVLHVEESQSDAYQELRDEQRRIKALPQLEAERAAAAAELEAVYAEVFPGPKNGRDTSAAALFGGRASGTDRFPTPVDLADKHILRGRGDNVLSRLSPDAAARFTEAAERYSRASSRAKLAQKSTDDAARRSATDPNMEGSAYAPRWQMTHLKSAIDDAVRMGRRYVTFNSGHDIGTVVTGGGPKLAETMRTRLTALDEALQGRLTSTQRAELIAERAELVDELAGVERPLKGLDKAYGDDLRALVSEWEKQHGVSLNVHERMLRPGFITDAGLARQLRETNDDLMMDARDVMERSFSKTDASQKALKIQTGTDELADAKAGGRKVLAIEITPEIRAMVENKGQSLYTMGSGTAAGAAADAMSGDEEERRGLATGLGVDALAAGILGSRRRGLGKRAVAAAKAANLANLPDPTPPRVRPPSAEGAAGFGNASPRGPVDVRDYANYEARWRAYQNDPTGKLAMDQQIAKVVQERGATFRDRVTEKDVLERANRLGLDPTAVLDAGRKRGLRFDEQVALADMTATNIDRMVELRKLSASPTTPAAEQQLIQRELGALEQQTNEMIWMGLTERTAAGRTLAFQKIAARRTLDPGFWAAEAAKNLGSRDRLTIDHVAEIGRLTAAKDRAGLVAYVRGLKPGKMGRVLTTAYKAGLLTNPTTHAANVTSNVLMAGAETAKDAPASLADRALTGLLNAALGSDKVRRSRDFSVESVRSSVAGAKEGARHIGATLRGKEAALPSAAGKWDEGMAETRVNTGNPAVDGLVNGYLNGPFRLLRAADNVFREAAFARSLEQQRRLANMPKAASLDDAVKGSTNDMILRAIADAEIATFQNQSLIGDFGAGMKRSMEKAGGQVGRAVGEFLFPFVKTPGAVASSVVRYSPLGLARGAYGVGDLLLRQLREMKAQTAQHAKLVASGATPAEVRFSSEQLDEQIKLIQQLKDATVDRVGRGVLGSAVMAMGAIMAQNGMLTVKPARTDRTGRETGEVVGDPGNTIDFGPVKGQIDRLSPIANLLLLGAYAVKGFEERNPQSVLSELRAKANRTAAETQQMLALEAQREEDGARLFESKWGTAIAASIAAIGNTIVEQPVFSGVKRIEDALNDPVKAAQGAFYNQFASVVPTGVSAVARAIDATRRDTETLGENVRSRIPGVSRTVAPKTDALGTPIREPAWVRAANLVSPVRLTTDRTSGDTPDARVRKLLKDLDIPLSRVSQREKDGETIGQARERQVLVGGAIHNRLQSILGTIEQIDPSQRKEFVQRQIQRARNSGNRAARAKQRRTLFENSDEVFDGQR